MHISRINIDPNKMDGAPCIRDLRLPVATVIDMLASGMSSAEILADFPMLEQEDIEEVLRYASAALQDL
jgi:uncharacterized protein (DUF433 family)